MTFDRLGGFWWGNIGCSLPSVACGGMHICPVSHMQDCTVVASSVSAADPDLSIAGIECDMMFLPTEI
jgi:hypothetical protein